MLCAPHLVPLADYLGNLMSGRPWCYWAFPGWWSVEDRGRYTLSIVVDGEAGHFPTSTLDLRVITPHLLTVAAAPDLELADLEARWINRDRGVTDRETDRIVASCIGAERGRGERVL